MYILWLFQIKVFFIFIGVDCRRDTRYCDPNASCVLNVDTFFCLCNQGYAGDGRTCQRKFMFIYSKIHRDFRSIKSCLPIILLM